MERIIRIILLILLINLWNPIIEIIRRKRFLCIIIWIFAVYCVIYRVLFVIY